MNEKKIEILGYKNRIELLTSRGAYNQALVAKLERRLRQAERELADQK